MPLTIPDLTSDVVWGAICIFGGAALAAGGGVGGGGLYVPLLIIVCSLDTKEAIPLSQACIFGAAIIHFGINTLKPHPFNRGENVVDFGTLLTMEPLLLSGATVGIILNGILPSFLILIVLVITLAFASYKMVLRSIRNCGPQNQLVESIKYNTKGNNETNGQMYVLDDAIKKEKSRTANNRSSSNLEMIPAGGMPTAATATGASSDHGNESSGRGEGQRGSSVGGMAPEGCVPSRASDLAAMFLLWAVVISFQIVRGSNKLESLVNIEFCSGTYWLLTFVLIPITMAFAWKFGKRAKFDTPTIWKFQAIGFFAGCLAGCLGIGGGLILSPLLLELEYVPEVASAISGMAVVVTSSSSLALYGLSGKVLWDYATLMMPVTLLATLIGKILVDDYARRNNMQNLITITVAVFLCCCFVLMSIQSTIGLMQDIENGDTGFTGPCSGEE